MRQPPVETTWRRATPSALALALIISACSGVDETTSLREAPIQSEQTTTSTSPPTTASSTIASSSTSSSAPSTTTPTSAAPTTTAPTERPLPTDPASLASELTQAERAIRDPELDGPSARQWGERLQRLYRVLSANRDWADATLAAVEPDVRPDVELNWSARQDLSALVNSTTLSSTLPAWRLRDPLPVDELREYYEEAETQTAVPWEILAAVHLIETRMGRIEGFSTAGAIGPMQFLPSTWAECCEGDPAVDRDAIIGAGEYLRQRGAGTDLDRALFGYNNSDRYVRAVRAYASVMERDPLAYRGYHAFEVYFLSSAGLIRMPSGYEEPEPVDATEWLAEHPEALVD